MQLELRRLIACRAPCARCESETAMRGTTFCAVCLLVATAGTAMAAPAPKKGKAGPAVPVVAVVPMTPESFSDAALVSDVNGAVIEAAKGVTEPHVLAGKDLVRAAKTAKPGSRCAGKPKCLGALGKRIKAIEVVFCEASAVEDGVKLSFQAVDTKTGEVSRGVEVMVASGEAAADVVRSHFFEILGLPPGAEEPPGPAVPSPAPATDGGQAATEGFEFDLGDMAKPATADATSPPPPASQPPAETVDSAPAEPAEKANVGTTEAVQATVAPAPAGRSAFLPVGVTLAATGVAALGGGAYFGMRVKSLRSGISSDLTQTDARKRVEDANSAAGRATILLAAGGACAGLGVVAVLVDLLFLGSSNHTMKVEAAPGGAAVSLSF